MAMTLKQYVTAIVDKHGRGAQYHITAGDLLDLLERMDALEKNTNLSTHGLKAWARRCGCISCIGALYNVNYSVRDYARSMGDHRRWARTNRVYAIQHLRDVVTSVYTKHERK